ncbi:peroxisomal membrane protein PEX14 isoform X2 [Atheta coriaria]|uniref:peroxisomal membrane protein PEX14 isoform X2 n=1 Tax=Dalotia coriaria TaxID=877792 RepID=UPI0031F3B34A
MTTTVDDLDRTFNQNPAPREDIIQTAVKFLSNANVVRTPLAQKQKFLQRKGLTNEEVQIACERSGAYAQHEEVQRTPPPLPPQLVPVGYRQHAQQQITLFDRIRDIVHNAAVFSIVAYAIYKFYEKYIKPFLFGIRKKSVEDSIEDLSKSVSESVTELKDSLQSVKVEVDRISQSGESHVQRQLEVLQGDIATVKGLLLSRKQFPSVSNSPVVPQSIPAWQLSSVQDEAEADPDPKSEELMDMCSGSGSSDPEHATKTSDSSLEIM